MPQRSTSKCFICLDVTRCKVKCRKRHSVCQECFPKYIESLCENYPKLKSNKLKVRCPVSKCTSAPYTDVRLKNILVPKLFQRLKDVINQDFSETSNSTDPSTGDTSPESLLASQILDVLNLKCPICKHVVDPNPDGCAAMVCPHCAGYFCWLCFQQTPGDAHPHVLTCQLNATGGQYQNYFPSQAMKDAAHKVYRMNALTALLQPKVATLDLVALQAVLNTAAPSLAHCDITADELLSALNIQNGGGTGGSGSSSSSSSSSGAIKLKKRKGPSRELRMLLL